MEQPPNAETGPIKIPVTPVPQSPTVQLVLDIEKLTGSKWTQDVRAEVADKIREYRFLQTGAVVARIQTLVRESGNAKLIDLIYSGKF